MNENFYKGFGSNDKRIDQIKGLLNDFVSEREVSDDYDEEKITKIK